MKIAYDPQAFCAQTYGGVLRYFCEIAPRIAKFPQAQVSIVGRCTSMSIWRAFQKPSFPDFLGLKKSIFAWKKLLTDDEIKRIKDNTHEMASAFYTEEDWIG